ncbi:MarR family winged helix-turn-helix transcriptional regulator [Alteromonas sp. 14N.309.X.WAT.G.H12]|uniref:MarR family winged helix-turn-helix transcriptional regulator n=1 Tax=Alteromonas sp. 14N.309.X.WAT.G.H12 TaxID=3120824 RepID=UPI002FD58814
MTVNTIEATFHLAHAIKQQFCSELDARKLNITPMHGRVLKIIHKKKTTTAVDIAGFFKRDKAQITRLVTHLIAQGLVKKEANPHDKRSQLLALTPQGEALQESLFAFSQQMQQQMTQDIDPEALATFVKVAQKMTDNMADK